MTMCVEITDQEKECVEKLREILKSNISPEMYNDTSLFYRFLKARGFNLDNAEKMIRKHLEWRKAKKVDTILTDFKQLEVFEKYLPYSRIGFDKEGAACRYAQVGHVDIKGLYMSAKIPDFEIAVIQNIESDIVAMQDRNKKFGTKADKFVYIFDFEDTSFATVTDKKAINVFICMLTTFQDNYPERLKAAYVLNASIYFTICFPLVKNFLENTILSKVHIFGKEGWKEELLRIIDSEELPAFLGGKKTDPDGNPLCKTSICHGGTVPEKYHVYKNKRSLIDAPGSKKITLSRASFYEMIVEVEEPGSLIEWEFETKNRDIGFGVFYKEMVEEEEKITELISLQRIDTEMYLETGMYRCDKAGTYILLFDNTYSWIRAKEIYFKVVVVSSKEHKAALKH